MYVFPADDFSFKQEGEKDGRVVGCLYVLYSPIADFLFLFQTARKEGKMEKDAKRAYIRCVLYPTMTTSAQILLSFTLLSLTTISCRWKRCEEAYEVYEYYTYFTMTASA